MFLHQQKTPIKESQYFWFCILVSAFFFPRVTLRGEPNEDAVLCTQSKTYAIKFVGNSNSVFLIPPVGQSKMHGHKQCSDEKDDNQRVVASVIKVAPGNMELVEVAPRLDKLKMLLLENPYPSEKFSEKELLEGMEEEKTSLFQWSDLKERVQASDDELKSGLQALSAVEIDGYWRIVNEKYMDTILTMLLHSSVLNDWSLDALGEAEVVGVLESDGFPHALGLHCLQVYGTKVDEGVGDCIWKMDERRVCIHFAREILKGGKRKMESFMNEWTQKIPDGMQASFEMLEGEVLTEKFGVETWVHAFRASSLPSNPAERFSILFQERPKWEWKDLQPYIRFSSVSFSCPL